MISPPQAARLIGRHCTPLGAVLLPLDRALGRVLAKDVRASHALPHFDNSAMDGYALRAADTKAATTSTPAHLTLRATIFAGDTKRRSLGKGEACGIMTGAPIPRGADTIVPVEHARVERSQLVITEAIPARRHVRKRGEELERGVMLVQRGTVVHPGVIACVATAGIAHVPVIRRPAVSVIATGSETVQPGRKLRHGQIYDSNSHTIIAALRDMGIDEVYRRRVKDRPAALDDAVRTALGRSDVVVVIGGVSVGERDYVRASLQRHRVKQVLWRVAQKPGKPLYFGHRGKKLVFGLPGNPASAFTCFYLYVYPALRRLAGHANADLSDRAESPVKPVRGDATRWLFLKGKSDTRGRVTLLAGQGSHMIAALAQANRLIVVPAGEADVTTLRLPYAEDES